MNTNSRSLHLETGELSLDGKAMLNAVTFLGELTRLDEGWRCEYCSEDILREAGLLLIEGDICGFYALKTFLNAKILCL